MKNHTKFLVVFLGILVPIFAGLYVRFDDIKIWQKYPGVFYYENKVPLFTGYDAFYFARWAKEYKDHTYKAGQTDPLRFVPDNFLTENPKYPKIIPLLSFIGAKLSGQKEIENVAFWLIPMLSVAFVVPFFLFFYKNNFPVAGFAGSLMGVICYVYLVRTSIVRYDTDALNLFFPALSSLFFLFYLNAQKKTRFFYLLLSGLSLQFYYWWYAHPGIILLQLFCFVMTVFLYDSFRVRKNRLKDLFLLLLFVNPIILWEGVFNFMNLVRTYIINFFRSDVDYGFPNIFQTISEAQKFEFIKTGSYVAGHYILFALGFSGIFLLIKRIYKSFLLIAPLFLIGLMCLKGGNRFIMYLAPFVGAGLGAFFDVFLDYIKKYRTFAKVAFMAFLAIIIIVANKNSFSYVATPKITPALYKDFKKLKEITSDDAWIWTWWDYGTAIQYLSRRAVYHDPQSQGSPKTHFVAKSFATDNQTVTWNLIKGISNLGANGIKELLDSKSEDVFTLANKLVSGKYNASFKHPVYLLFTQDLIGKFPAIYYLGSWDYKKKKGKNGRLFILKNCITRYNKVICKDHVLDLQTGILNLKKRDGSYIDLKPNQIAIKGKKTIINKFYDTNISFDVLPNERLVVILDNNLFNSSFNQLFILRNYDIKYFDLVYDHFPVMVLYKVKN